MLKYFQITINIYFALMLLFCSNIYVTIMINNFIIIDSCVTVLIITIIIIVIMVLCIFKTLQAKML